MNISQLFVEFIFYSFLGWVWESIYCTIKKRKWQDRGFLFGPVCPIYGSCIVVAKIVFTEVAVFSSADTPIWQIFLICVLGSAMAEFGTSWVLEKRFHAMWWDYSQQPFNIQGRICAPVSMAFGVAGVLLVKFVFPFMVNVTGRISTTGYEVLAIVFALLFGADYALTEASLSTLLKTVEAYKAEWNRKAETTYETVSSVPKRVHENATKTKEKIADHYISHMGFNQRRILANIKKFKPIKGEKILIDSHMIETLKEALHKHR